MSFLGELDGFVGELLQAVTAVDPESTRGKALRTKAVAKLKSHPYGRTNQFEIQKKLEGLEEKFRVFNQEELADALQQRRTELTSKNLSWTPEILSLFLELSDEPLIKTDVDGLRTLVQPEEPPEPTWEEIVRDDPLDETGVWDDIDYGAESSGDEYTQLTFDASSVHSVDLPNLNDTIIEEPVLESKTEGDAELRKILKSQFWSPRQQTSRPSSVNNQITVTELHAIREVLFMLSGLPTALYLQDASGEIIVNQDYALANISNLSFHSVLRELAVYGTRISALKKWTSTDPGSSLLQMFSAEIEIRLRDLRQLLAEMQQRFVHPQGSVVVSLAQLIDEIQHHLSLVLELSDLVSSLQSEEGSAFQCLELLYQKICDLQAVGDITLYREMIAIFSVCFDAYLVPIKAWMLYGEIQLRNDTLFIEKAPETKSLDTLWHEHYRIRRGEAGDVLAPSFLAPLVNSVFAAGKSVLFHDALLSFTLKKEQLDSDSQVFSLNSEALESSLIPFSELVRVAFEKYLRQRQSPSVTLLPKLLKEETDLFKSLRGMHLVYFMTDGHAATQITSTIFTKMDRNKPWNDRFLLTDLFQSTYEAFPDVDKDCIVARTSSTPGSNDRKSLRSLESIRIEYRLPWAVMNIVQRSSIPIYQSVYTLLLQILRAKHILEKDRILPPPSTRLSEPRKDDLYHLTRFKLIWFANILLNHTTSFILAPQIEKLYEDLQKAETVDEMISRHETALKEIESLCMLSSNFKPIHDAILAILDLAQPLAEFNPFVEERLLGLSTRSTVTISRPGRHRRRRRKIEEDDDEDDESSSGDEDQDGAYRRDMDISSSKTKLRKIAASFERHVGFIRAGIKGIARVGEGSAWAVLSELLELKDERSRFA